MPLSSVIAALQSLTQGKTTIINGHVVTRYPSGRYEIDTWGRASKSLSEAAAIITYAK